MPAHVKGIVRVMFSSWKPNGYAVVKALIAATQKGNLADAGPNCLNKARGSFAFSPDCESREFKHLAQTRQIISHALGTSSYISLDLDLAQPNEEQMVRASWIGCNREINPKSEIPRVHTCIGSMRRVCCQADQV